MYKKGGKRTNWLQRHFTLFNGALCYYEKKETKTPKGFILTKDITEVRAEQAGKVGKKSGKGQFCLEVVTKARTYYFAPDTAELRDQWIAAIKTWIGYSEEDVSTKELPQPGASQRQSQTAATSGDAAAAPAAKADDEAEPKKADEPESKKADEPEPKKDDDEPDAKKDDSEPKKKDDDDDGSDSDDAKKDGSGVQLYEAQFDYDAQEDNELSFKEGDVITVLDTFKGAGWWKCQLNGNVGLVPQNFMTPYVKKE